MRGPTQADVFRSLLTSAFFVSVAVVLEHLKGHPMDEALVGELWGAELGLVGAEDCEAIL